MKKSRTSMIDTLFSRLGMKPRPAAPSRPRPFQAISIHHGMTCCTAAKRLSGVRMLTRNAPQLPLTDCNMRGACKCQYIKHVDRRGDSRRMVDYGLKQPLFAAKDKRLTRGRRSQD